MNQTDEIKLYEAGSEGYIYTLASKIGGNCLDNFLKKCTVKDRESLMVRLLLMIDEYGISKELFIDAEFAALKYIYAGKNRLCCLLLGENTLLILGEYRSIKSAIHFWVSEIERKLLAGNIIITPNGEMVGDLYIGNLN